MMKKLFGVAVISMFVLFSAQAQNIKFAYVNTDEIIQTLPDYDSALTVIENFRVELVNTLELMSVELNNKVETYNNEMNNYTEVVRQVKEQELNDLNRRIEEFQTSAQERLTTKQNELIEPLYNKVQTAINAVGNENGYAYIFEETNLRFIHADQAVNATPLIKAKLGIR